MKIKIRKERTLECSGAIVHNTSIDQQVSIDVSSLPSGLYVLQITSKNGVFIEKFIKE